MSQPANAAGTQLSVSGINKSYNTQRILFDVSVKVEPGEFVTFLGPSGCGKTTLLRTIAGFVTPDSGDVQVNGRSIGAMPPNKRNFGFVFQNYALFPHLTVRDNVAYGLKLRKMSKDQIANRVAEILDVVNLGQLAERYPKQLSGGQQQRVALARALAIRPDVLLLDEPLSNLDAKLRERIRVELRELQQRIGITTIFVTHDQEEAMSMSDRIVVMNGGRIEQIGRPAEIYQRPASAFVADFVGTNNIIDGKVIALDEDMATVASSVGTMRLAANGAGHGHAVKLCVRPETLTISASEFPGAVPATVQAVEFLGSSIRYTAAVKENEPLRILVTHPSEQIAVGARCFIGSDRDAGYLLS